MVKEGENLVGLQFRENGENPWPPLEDGNHKNHSTLV